MLPHRLSRLGGLAVIWIAIGIALPSSAQADEVTEAREHYKKGTSAFDLGAYDEAVTEYTAAYRLRADPALLYNLGQAHRLASHPAEALHFYRMFLAKVPDSPNRPQVENRISELQQQIDQQKSRQNRSPEPVTPPAVATVTPVERAVAPSRPAPTSATDRPGRAKRIAGISLAAAGVAILVGGAVSSALAQQASDKLTSLATHHQPFDYDLHQTGQLENAVGATLIGVGAAAIVAGGVVSIIGFREGRRASRISLAPTVGRGVVGLTIGEAF